MFKLSTIRNKKRSAKYIETDISNLVLTSLKIDSSYSTLYIPTFLITEFWKHKKITKL